MAVTSLTAMQGGLASKVTVSCMQAEACPCQPPPWGTLCRIWHGLAQTALRHGS